MNMTPRLDRDRGPGGQFVKKPHRKNPNAVPVPPHVDPRLVAVIAAGWVHGPTGWRHPVIGWGGGKLGALASAWETTQRYRDRWQRLLDEAAA